MTLPPWERWGSFRQALRLSAAIFCLGSMIAVVSSGEVAVTAAGAVWFAVFAWSVFRDRWLALTLLFMAQPFDQFLRAWAGTRFLTFAYLSLALVLLYGRQRLVNVVLGTPVRWMVLLTAWAALSGLWAPDAEAWIEEVAVLGGGAVGLIVVPTLVDHPRRVLQLLAAHGLGAVAVFVAVVGASQSWETVGVIDNISGAEMTHTWAFGVLALAFALSQEPRWGRQVLNGAGQLALTMGCLLNTSRATLVALVVAGVAALATAGGFVRRLRLLSGAVGVAVLAVWLSYQISPERLDSRLRQTIEAEGDSASSGRTTIWRAALESVRARPVLGLGAGGFFVSFDELYAAAGETYFAGRAKGAHSSYVQIAVEQGLVGFALFVLFLAAVAWMALRQGGPHRRHLLAWVLFAALVNGTGSARELPMFWLFGAAIYLARWHRASRSVASVRHG